MGEPEFEFFGEPRLVRLQKLLDEIRRGEIQIPRFQRPFVWTDDQRLLLMDSIYRGYPIGSILVWRTETHTLATHERLGPLVLPGGARGARAKTTNPLRQFLLDGHQRMTTLFSALGPALYTKKKQQVPLRDDISDDEPAWPVYFDLEKDDNSSPFLLPRKRSGVNDTWLPLDILFDSFALGEWEEKLRATLRLKKLQDVDERKLVNRARSVADAFRDYMVPMLPIATESLSQVTTSFMRINSGGTPMSEEHMVAALTYSASVGNEFDLDKKLEEVSAKLDSVGWGSFDRQMVLQVCKVRSGLEIYDEAPEALAGALKKDPLLMDAVASQITTAAGALRNAMNVRGPGMLPYSYQAVLLADALSGVDVDEAVLERVRKWLWATSLSEYFSGITKAIVNRARDNLRVLLRSKGAASPPNMSPIVAPFRRFDFRSARARAISILLAEQQPQDPTRREEDPFELLSLFGAEAMCKLVRESDLPRGHEKLSETPENRFLVHPRRAVALRAFFEPSLFPERLEGHLVTPAALARLQKGDRVGFLTERRRAIEELERARAESVGLQYQTDRTYPAP